MLDKPAVEVDLTVVQNVEMAIIPCDLCQSVHPQPVLSRVIVSTITLKLGKKVLFSSTLVLELQLPLLPVMFGDLARDGARFGSSKDGSMTDQQFPFVGPDSAQQYAGAPFGGFPTSFSPSGDMV